ncbi:galactokinase [Treponema phagedenis]|uniref:Galactokinase n=1 Tax=Treponema phagedenis TaxID=162 RepID=A0A0B7GUW5_TREPH|nr:galactokinase [Treponema phagedenis]NVP23286.1 galactokinase [Treponema phagedenis]QEJ95374.1 galactokinase [Treponema phagedenis]QEJ97913.1 galactokinase [Treponema phagedenis]QEK02264.1 galactokinase [Treponema phagedenis]QEK05172.1 galactokinase [Treponema phagedenis]
MQGQKHIQFLTDLNEEDTKKELLKEFEIRYGESNNSVIVIASPGRINIIGEHIDYNGGKVFPAAIDRFLYVLIRERSDTKIIYDDIRFPGRLVFDIHDTFTYDKKNDYANYLNGMYTILQNKGLNVLSGFEVLLFSKLPAGGGISSSSALEIGFGLALAKLFDFKIDGIALAKAGQQSEHEFMSVNCGIMDQFSIAMGKKNYAMLLDTASLEYEYVPLELKSYKFIVMNSNKQRSLADSKYNERRSECEEGLRLLQKALPVNFLCEITADDFFANQHLISDETIKKRVRHCIFENERVYKAVAALQKEDLKTLGELLNQSHQSLKSDYEVTGFELDCLQEAAVKQEGCLGARITGAGFGGCAIALVHKNSIDAFIESVSKEYFEKTGLRAEMFACKAGQGAAVL